MEDKETKVVPVTMVIVPAAVNADTLKEKIDSQGQKVRELKSAGKAKVVYDNSFQLESIVTILACSRRMLIRR